MLARCIVSTFLGQGNQTATHRAGLAVKGHSISAPIKYEVENFFPGELPPPVNVRSLPAPAPHPSRAPAPPPPIHGKKNRKASRRLLLASLRPDDFLRLNLGSAPPRAVAPSRALPLSTPPDPTHRMLTSNAAPSSIPTPPRRLLSPHFSYSRRRCPISHRHCH
jgi:hypothetical protein